ncbi:tRNA (adenosine(37)-N6)-threonylcarbamoyltransferase complex ATPase subunit type 1 TsaE [Desulfuromonas acetoxidans]|uniref:tRNA (adenosine(37)-N6)-threonylcarbamoyltransferase complex ATPase subunit type 1 TsaE n=1 Tax=Desulfuromonas acetoxidans TaxID=891 RepID=UPI00292E0B01|nr:tRNA (adenosine(37)-N6)-threonylcarbamoyltransferase complex ATPase subunit type 1 TsaE [Desulfuromonas acetoxidans]
MNSRRFVWAKRWGKLFPAGSLILLHGDLGAGKTCLASGIARGVGVDPDVPITSPTYTLLNCYEGRLPLYHFDLYRLGGEEELEELGFDEYFHGDGVCAGRMARALVPDLKRGRCLWKWPMWMNISVISVCRLQNHFAVNTMPVVGPFVAWQTVSMVERRELFSLVLRQIQ